MKSEGANRVKGKTVWLILLVIIVSCAFLIPVAYDRVMRILYPVAYEQTVLEHAQKNDLDP